MCIGSRVPPTNRSFKREPRGSHFIFLRRCSCHFDGVQRLDLVTSLLALFQNPFQLFPRLNAGAHPLHAPADDLSTCDLSNCDVRGGRSLGCRNALLLIAFASVVCIFPYLHTCEVFQVSEGREGVVVNAILEQQEWILPLRHGSVVPSKPPLFHWIGAAAATILGRNDEFVLRLPSALAAVGSLLAIGLFANSIGASEVGVLAAAILLTTYGFTRMAADGRVDMLLTMFVVAAILRWLSAYLRLRFVGESEPRMTSRVWFETAILCGLGMLAKGPLGLVLPVWVIAAVLIVEHGIWAVRQLVRWEWAVAFAVCAPWYVLATVRGQDSFLSRQVVFENLLRFVGGEGITPKPPWFYLAQFWGHAAPWSLCFGAWAATALWARYRGNSSLIEPSGRRALLIRVALTWFFAMVILFSLSAGKRRAYLLPTLPAMSLVLAVYGQLLVARLVEMKSLSRWFIGVWTFFGLFAYAVYVIAWGVSFDGAAGKRTLTAWLDVLQLNWSLWVVTVVALFAGALLVWLRAAKLNSPRLGVLAGFLVLQLGFLGLVNPMLAIKGVTHGFKRWSETVARKLEPGEPLTFVKRLRDESFDGFFFYFGRQVALAPRSELPTARGAYLARHEWFDLTPAAWRSALEIVAEGGRQADSDAERIVMFRIRERPPTPEFLFTEKVGRSDEGASD